MCLNLVSLLMKCSRKAKLPLTTTIDHITDDSRKYNRMKNLLDVLKRKQVYACFACTLESLQHTSLLNTLTIDTQYIESICEYIFCFFFIFLFWFVFLNFFYAYLTIYRYSLAEHAVCVQHNFTTLQDELPEADHATTMMENLLDESNLSDIQRCSGTIRQKAKLLKILILKGHDACRQLFNVIRSGLRRGDLIQKMINKNTEVIRRGTDIFMITNIKILNRCNDFFLYVHINLQSQACKCRFLFVFNLCFCIFFIIYLLLTFLIYVEDLTIFILKSNLI